MENYSCVTFGMQNPVGTTFEYYINVFKSGNPNYYNLWL